MHKLPVLQIANPCDLDFHTMRSIDDAGRARFCGDCKQNVYNLSAMTTAEAEALLVEHEGKLCIRYVARHDGTIQTTDCAPSRFETGRRATSRVTASAIALAMSTMAAILTLGVAASYQDEIRAFVMESLGQRGGPTMGVMMGEMEPHMATPSEHVVTDAPSP